MELDNYTRLYDLRALGTQRRDVSLTTNTTSNEQGDVLSCLMFMSTSSFQLNV